MVSWVDGALNLDREAILNMRANKLAFLLGGLSILFTACENEAGPELPPLGTVRLADLLDAASIQSPLTKIPAARGLEQLRDIRSRIVFFEDFEDYDLEQAGHVNAPDDAIVETELGRSFYLREGGQSNRARLG